MSPLIEALFALSLWLAVSALITKAFSDATHQHRTYTERWKQYLDQHPVNATCSSTPGVDRLRFLRCLSHNERLYQSLD